MTSQQRFDELDAVVKQQRDSVAALHASSGEDGGEARCSIVELRVSSYVVSEHHGGMVRT